MRGLGWTIATMLFAAVTATGCNRQAAAPEAAPTAAQRKPTAPRAPGAPAAVPALAGAEATDGSAPAAEPAVYAYDRTGKRDPFRSFVLESLEQADESTKGPLEQFELGQLALLGVVWETNNRRALVVDPSGQGYIVSEGDAVGKNDGRVLRIDDNLVLVRETYVDYVGERIEKEIEMRVRQAEGG